MFVRKDKDGNLVAVGSIDRNRLTQLQGKPKKSTAKAAEPKDAAAKAAEPEAVEPEVKPDEPKAKSVSSATSEFKSALDL